MISSLPKLTSRQAEILHLVEKSIQEFGAPPTRSEIAKQLGLSPFTVGTFTKRIYLKLGVHNRVELANKIHGFERGNSR